MDGFASELRIALRTLIGRERAYAVLAVLMLALGVAGGTAVFCVYDGTALRPLPYRDSGALYWIWSVRPDVDRAFFSIPDLHDFRARSRQTSDIAALTPFGGNHWRGEDSRRVNGLRVDDRFFPLLGVQPAFGRLIDETDARDNTRVIVLGWDLFQRELGGDMHRLAEPWNMNGEAWQVIGVLPESFVFPGPDADLHFAVPLSMVREILPIDVNEVQEVGGRATMVVRGEVMPIYPLRALLGWAPEGIPEYGVLMQTAEHAFILAIDGFMGREDAVIKSLEDFRPKGVAGVTTLSNGQIVLILDMKEILAAMGESRGVPRSAFIPLAAA